MMIRKVCLLLTFLVGVESKNSYLFIAPNTIRPGRDLTIQGSLLKEPRDTVTLTATVKKAGLEIASTQLQVTDTNDVILDIPIPNDLEDGIYDLLIKGQGRRTNFDQTKTLEYKKKGISVYIQTDKKFYKPGQSIHFRVFAIDPDLKIATDKLHVDLFDPEGTKINQWDASNFELKESDGVYVGKQLMSDYPEFGKWKFVATMRNMKEEQQFEVDEYVLPKFEVKLDLPSFGRAKDTSFDGKVTAKYTFGKPVKGKVHLRIRSKRERFVWRNNRRESTNKEIELHFPIDGEAKFHLSKSKLTELEKSLNGETLVFDANVTETLTNFKLGDSEDVKFYNNPMKVEFPSSLPDTFNPGMDFIGVIKVSLVDGSPLDTIAGDLKLTVTETRLRRRRRWYEPEPEPWWRRRGRSWRWRPWRPRPPVPVETTKDRNPQYLVVPPNGLVSFKIRTSDDVTKLSLKAEYSDSSASKSLKKRHSPSDNFLQITITADKLQAGEKALFEIRTTERPREINYQIFSRGSIVEFGTKPARRTYNTLPLLLTQAMAPRSTLVVFYVRSDGEVVADSITVNIQGVFKNKVNIAFNTTHAKPADSVDLRVSAHAGSRVNLLAVDKSVQLLGTGNDISKDKVLQELQSYNNKGKTSGSEGPVCDWFCWRWPLPSGGKDVKDVFDEAGVIVLTDALIYEYREPTPPPPPVWDVPWERPMFASRGFGAGLDAVSGIAGARMMGGANLALPMAVPETADFLGSGGTVPVLDMKPIISKDNVAPVTRTRKLFPETWLWKSTSVDSSGNAILTEALPDTITSWIATAFATHPEAGFGLSESPAQIEVSKKFFVSVQLPYSVIRKEQLVIQANVFNYGPEQEFAYVTLAQSNEFENLDISAKGTTSSSSDVIRTVNVAPDGVETVYFPIVPTKRGRSKINIKAQSATAADAIIKELLVEAEGTPREYNLPAMIDLKTPGTFTKSVTVEYPIRKVRDSERVQVTVIGDLMGPSINGLDKLLKMPYGCGEQNMLNFAPNIFIVKYLEATNNIDDAIMDKAKEYMEKGFQRELTFRHDDGSISAFGKRDDSGSIWLTAFVLKSFVQAKPYIFIEDGIIIKMVDWIVKFQNKNGSFWEPGRVIHKAMQGGSTSGEVSLTAYVLVALLEARSVEGVAGKIDSAKTNSQKFLEDQLTSLTDVYDLAIVSYALQLAGSPRARKAWNKLDKKAQTNGGLKWWKKDPVKTTKDLKPWQKRTGQAINIEISAYALLTLAARGDTVDGLPVLKWITEQRNPNGGFSSTQDTVVALHGLSELASQIYSGNVDMTVNIVGRGFSDTLTVNALNARVLQIRELPADVGEVTITAQGRGFSLAQVEVFYNIDDDDQKDSFLLSVSLPMETMNMYNVSACFSWTEPGTSSMAVLDIGFPTGFIADKESVSSTPLKHKIAELEPRKLLLYYDEIERSDTCVSVTLHRIGLVASAQPVPVKIYDYYEPTKQVTVFHIPEVIRASTVCDVCGTECDFCRN